MRPGAALVTGGAKRLGRAMALSLARRGWDVAIHYHGSESEAQETEAGIRALGRCTAMLQADLTDEQATQALIARAVEALGPLSLLVNNASIFEHDTLQSATLQGWERHMASNLRAPFVLSQHFAAQAPAGAMHEGEPVASACIVNMIDQRVLKPTPHFSSYTLAKAGLWMLTRTAAQGLAPDIRVNAIGPGPTVKGVRQSQAHFDAQRAGLPLKRGADAGEICAALGFILDADSLTGQLIALDGGQHIGWRTPDIVGKFE